MTARPRYFNGTCDGCGNFRPRCGKVRVRAPGATGRAAVYDSRPTVLCDACRAKNRGNFRYAR